MADTKLYELLGVSRNASDSEIRKVMYQLLNLCYNYYFFFRSSFILLFLLPNILGISGFNCEMSTVTICERVTA